MTIEDQLKNEILSKYKSIRSFTTAIQIPYTTLDSVFKRGISNAGIGTMLKVFCALDLDIESIQTGQLKHREETIKEPTSENASEFSENERIFKSLPSDLRQEALRYMRYLAEQEGRQ